jgi:hypothetical protein
MRSRLRLARAKPRILVALCVFATMSLSPPPAGAATSNSAGTWVPLAATSLSPREGHSAVWTGTEMLIWGGRGLAAV